MMVDFKGERFVDETAGGHFTSNALARHGNSLAYVILTMPCGTASAGISSARRTRIS